MVVEVFEENVNIETFQISVTWGDDDLVTARRLQVASPVTFTTLSAPSHGQQSAEETTRR